MQDKIDSNMSDLVDADASHPKLWIAHWTYKKPELALVYIITNGVSGIMFNEGLKLMHTPDNKWVIHHFNGTSQSFKFFDIEFI